jgi:hypothetical protein
MITGGEQESNEYITANAPFGFPVRVIRMRLHERETHSTNTRYHYWRLADK